MPDLALRLCRPALRPAAAGSRLSRPLEPATPASTRTIAFSSSLMWILDWIMLKAGHCSSTCHLRARRAVSYTRARNSTGSSRVSCIFCARRGHGTHPQPRGPRPDLEAGEAGGGGGGSPEPPKAAEFNAIRQIPNATIETRKDEADFRIVRQLEDAIARFTSQQKRNAPIESEEDVAPNEIAASHQQSPGPRPVERADLRADAAGRGGRRSREPAKAAAGLNASRQSRNGTIESEEHDVTFGVETPHGQPGDDPPPAGQADLIGSRKLNLTPISTTVS
jgi:hypothetical protein